jgi:hypothetical protein
MDWTYDPDGRVTDRSAIEYLLAGGTLYECEPGCFCPVDRQEVSAALVARLTESGHLSRGDRPIQLTDPGRRELRVPRA